jgi:hypothetical protein
MKAFVVTTCLLLSLSLPAVSLAQTATAEPKTADTAKPSTMSPDEKKAKSKECSTEADAKGLHGEARKKFRSECKHKK